MRGSKESRERSGPNLPAPGRHPIGWRRIALDAVGAGDAVRRWEPVDPRHNQRVAIEAHAMTTTIDPVRDAVTGELCFQTDDDAHTVNVSRRGVCLRCLRPPEVGTRFLLQLQLDAQERPIEMVGRTRWSRVEYLPGNHGARAVAVVGVELMGGSPRALDRYEQTLQTLCDQAAQVAGAEALG